MPTESPRPFGYGGPLRLLPRASHSRYVYQLPDGTTFRRWCLHRSDSMHHSKKIIQQVATNES